jgi:hypothetical protein
MKRIYCTNFSKTPPPEQARYKGIGTVGSFSGVKRPESAADYPLPPNAEDMVLM